MRTTEFAPVGVAAGAALTAVLGGAFFPGQRLVVGVFFALLLGCFGWQWRGRPLEPAEWALLALVSWGTVSATLVGMSPLAAKEVLTGWLIGWCLWVAARRARPRTARLGAAVLIVVAILVVAGIGLEAIGRGDIRVGGLLENPNLAAALLVVTMPLVVVCATGHGNRWPFAVVAALASGVGLSGSRAGLLAMLVAGVALLPKGRIRAAGAAIGTVAVMSILAWRFASQPDVLAWFRPAIWLALLRLWATRPLFGVGPGGLRDVAGPIRLLHEDHVGQHQFLVTYAESSPLGLLVQTGIVGLLLAVIAVVLWVRRSRGEGALAFAPLRSVVMGMVVMAAFHDFVTIEVVVWWWAVAFGLIEAARPTADPKHQTTQEEGWTKGLRGLVLALVVLWGVVQPAWAKWLWHADRPGMARAERAAAAEPWFDDPLAWRAQVLLDESTWTWPMAAEALAVSRRAVRIHPGDSRSWLILGQVRYRTISELGPWPDCVADARVAFARASELEPLLPWPWLEWARLERALGNLEEATALVRRALDSEPHTVRAWLFLARLELDSGNMRMARDALVSASRSASMRRRPGLTTYEKELLSAPPWQFREIEEALR